MRHTIIDNRYRVLKKCGSGATSNVYKARDLKNNTIIALKILSKTKTSSDVVQHFRREFRLLAGLRHPNLCSVHDFGILKDSRSYFTMDYIEGKDIFKATKGLSNEKIYPWIVQLCRVLEYIHSKGLIHYDIKPGNVLITWDKEQGVESNKKHYAQGPILYAKLLDFGLAGEQKTKDGTLVRGTFPYIAPEVIKGLTVDLRADLYSLGVLLYKIFTRKSFKTDGETSFATLFEQQQQIVSKPPSKLVAGIPKRLEQLIIRLLKSEPAARFSRANEVIKEINKISHLKFDIETEKTIEGYLLSSRFVGRNNEMGLLKSFYERALQGYGKVVLVTGDAGIGKSRLLKEFKVFVQLKHGHCLAGYAYRDKIAPLEPFYDIFNELINHIHREPDLLHARELKFSLAVLFKMFPDLTVKNLRKNLPKLMPLEPEQERVRNLNALSELIRFGASCLGELTIVLEDMHWADDLSIQFLEYLGRNLVGRNILICGTCRKEELEENPKLKIMMTNLSNEGYLTQVELRPLKFRNLYSFLDSTITPGSNSSELVRYLMRKTGGNPFFVEEIMRTLLRKRDVSIGERIETTHFRKLALPKRIDNIVLKRIEDLDQTSQRIIKFAAILLKSFSYNLMKRLTDLDDTELSRSLWELNKRRVLIEENNKYRFYHTILREAVYKRLGDKERSDLNYQIGKTLERINRQRLSKVVEDLAYYFINARNSKKGVRYGLRAAKKSSKKYANEQAIRFYKNVLGFLGSKDMERRFDILQKLAQIEVLVGCYDDAIKHYRRALSLKGVAITKKIEDCLAIGDIYVRRREYNKALHIYQRGIRFLKKMKSGRSKALLETNTNVKICGVYLRKGDYKNANKLRFDALKFSRYLAGRKALKLLCSIYHNMGVIENIKSHYGKGNIDKAIAYSNEACKYYKKLKSDDRMATVFINLGMSYSFKLDFQKALGCYQKSIRISEKIGDSYGVSIGLCNLHNLLQDRGHHSKALDCSQRTLIISKKNGNFFIAGISLVGLGNCYFKLCDYKEAIKCCETALKIFDDRGWQGYTIYPLRTIAGVYKSMGDYTLALKFYRKALKSVKDVKFQNAIVGLFIDIALFFVEIGVFPKAHRYIEDALEIATTLKLKEEKIDCNIVLCQINTIKRDYVVANDYYENGIMNAQGLDLKRQSLHFFLLGSDINYHEKKYLKGIKICNKAVKLAQEMRTKDLYAEALLIRAKNEIKHRVLSRIEILTLLNQAKKIGEEIGCPEVLWKVYFEYGRFLQENKEHHKSLEYYRKCTMVFRDVMNKMKNDSYKRSYLNRPDRREAITVINTD